MGSFFCLFHYDLDAIRNELQLAISGPRFLDTDFRVITADGGPSRIKAGGITISNDGGSPVRLISINQDATDKIEKEEQIRQQTNYDALTLLPDRKFFHDLLDQEIKEAHRRIKGFSL